MIVVFGATHLGVTLAGYLAKEHRDVLVIDQVALQEQPEGWEYRRGSFNAFPGIEQARIVYAVTDEDRINIRIALVVRSASRSVPICVALTQSRLGEKLARHLNNFYFVNPPELAARSFVEAVYAEAEHHKESSSPSAVVDESEARLRPDPIIYRALIAFFALAFCSSIYFSYSENLSWIDSVYFVITMMTTVGFGDINLKDSSILSKIVGIVLMLASVAATSAIVALMTDSLLKYRLVLSFGRWQVNESNHIIVVGAGAVGSKVVDELLKRGERVVVVDSEPNGRYMPSVYARKVPTIIGDGRSGHILRNAGLMRAKAILSVTQDDLTNLEVGLSAKYYNPKLRVVLRIYDQLLASSLHQRLDIPFAFSMSSVAAGALVKQLPN